LSRRVYLIATRRVEVTLGGGCRPRTVALLVGHREIAKFSAGKRALHARGVALALAAGWYTLSLKTLPAKHSPACSSPVIDRLDFVPARGSDGVLLGAAMRASELEADVRYRALFLRHFNSLTPENELKMVNVEPRQGEFVFGPADELVDFAHGAGDQVRGHTLVYGSQLPQWVTNPLIPWTPSSLLRVMQTYITTVMHRYASEINTWDVVNEAFNANGSYRRNVWYDVIGPSYVADAFHFAHAADPHGELFYNDLGGELPGPKATAILQLVESFRRSGIPIDGIGLQDHTDVPGYPVQDALQGMISAYARLGMRVEITELDVGTLGAPGTTGQKDLAQAAAYRAQATACWDIAACHRLTTWGLYDGLTWVGSDQAPLLFDQNFKPKPAFFAVEHALHRH
jgi:endo-1,4-beta-xylanase